MSNCVCLNCGEIKFGALTECEYCHVGPPDIKISCLLTNHYLGEDELLKIGEAIKIILKTVKDKDIRFLSIAYYLSMKWPKILDFNSNSVEQEAMRIIDKHYSTYLSHLPGQNDLTEKLKSNLPNMYWDKAVNKALQEGDDTWKAAVPFIVEKGLNLSGKIIKTKISIGEGAILQKIKYRIKNFFFRPNYYLIYKELELITKEVEAYDRDVDEFCKVVRNGWSGRTKEQCAYLRGTCSRMKEMIENCKTITMYKGRKGDIVKIDHKIAVQKLNNSYKKYIELVNVVLEPHLIIEE